MEFSTSTCPSRKYSLIIIVLLSIICLAMFMMQLTQNVDITATVAVGQQTCNFTAFQRELQLDVWSPVVPTHLLATCRHVFYNRHPKTASRTMIEIIRTLGKRHKFKTIVTASDGQWKYIDENMLEMQHATYKFVSVTHMLYHDFRSISRLTDTSIYINVIREPAAWFISWYNWNKHGPAIKRNFFNESRQISIDECIENVTCSQHHKASAIHYLCGEENVCSTRTGEALKRATQRLNEDYLSVGLTERLEDTLEVWEYLMPHMFRGARDIFDDIAAESKSRTMLKPKSTVDNTHLELLKSNLDLDYKMYNIVSERLDKMLTVIRLLEGMHPEGYRTAWNMHYMRVIKTWIKNIFQFS